MLRLELHLQDRDGRWALGPLPLVALAAAFIRERLSFNVYVYVYVCV